MTAFPTTRWTLVLSGAQPAALAELLAMYRAPLYVFARRSGLCAADAEDAVQSFAVTALERSIFARAERDKGRLRTFLKTAFRHHLADVRDKGSALKRGGASAHVDFADAEAFVASQTLDPEQAFDAKWARLVMQRALAALQADFADDFALVRTYFDGEMLGLKEEAARAQMSETRLKSLLHRARSKYRAHLLALVADTVDAGTSAEDELRALMKAAA